MRQTQVLLLVDSVLCPVVLEPFPDGVPAAAAALAAARRPRMVAQTLDDAVVVRVGERQHVTSAAGRLFALLPLRVDDQH